jgi:signal transduction histidine kinase
MKTTNRARIGKETHWVKALMFPILCLCLISAPLSYPRADQSKHVLVIHSYHQGLGWTDRITKGIESALHRTDQEINLSFEYMDTKRIYDAQHFENLYELYRHKFRNRRFDVIVSSDDHAFRFLLCHHRELFPDTPIVFCGVNGFEDSMLLDHGLITGVAELDDFKSTIDVVLQLQPNTEQVFVIVDKTLTGSIGERLMKKGIPHFKDTLRFTFWKNLDMAQVQERAGKLTPDSIAFLYTFTTDRSGNVFTLEKSCELISQYCAVPIYAAADAYIGHGIIGGMLTSGYAQGEKAGQIALRILHGEKVKDIPVVKKSPNRYMFDYQQMQRFGVDLSSLPEGSTVINKPYSFYSEHKRLIWSVVASIAGLLLIIVILSVNIINRRRAEQELKTYRDHLEELVENRTRELEEINTELEAFAYSVSHDLRAPLRAIQGFSQALREDYAPKLDAQGKDYARRMDDSARRMETLIQDLLDYSRLSRSEIKLTPVDLTSVVEHVLTQLEAEIKDKDAHLRVDKPLPKVLAHSVTLDQVVENLIANAIKFVPPGVQPHIHLWAEQRDKVVRLWVEDNGIGIAPEHHERIFRIFERLHGIETYPGTGIGLATVKKGMEKMSGTIGLESVPDKGSRFWIELPKRKKQ